MAIFSHFLAFYYVILPFFPKKTWAKDSSVFGQEGPIFTKINDLAAEGPLNLFFTKNNERVSP